MVRMSIVLIFVLGIWLLITVVAHRRFTTANRLVYVVHSLKWRDYCGLIPSWSFFAPEPPIADYRVLYRDWVDDASFTPWQEMPPPRTSHAPSIWNPYMRRGKAILDMCARIDQLAGRGTIHPPSPALFTSIPYRAVLRQVIDQPRSLRSDHRQFMIAVTTAPRAPTGPEVVFLSPLHAL